MESAPSPELVADAARAILDSEVVVEAAAPGIELDVLFPEERRYVEASASSGWAPARLREFAAARASARRALARLGVAPAALVPHADRSPRWPDGIVGSITHTRDLCLVAVARRGRIASLGVDVERVTAVTDIEELVCTPAERRWLDAQPAAQRGPNVHLFFSAKEAFYKCQYPLTTTYLDFHDVELAIVADGTFAARIIGTAHAALNRDLAGARGRWARLGSVVVTTAEVRSPLPSATEG